MSSTSQTPSLTVEESKEFLSFCRAGKLYAIEVWIRNGKSIEVAAKLPRTPIDIAFDTGFHSLIELLVRSEKSPDGKNRSLRAAVANRSLEFAELAIKLGADFSAVPFVDVLRTWDPKLMRYFVALGSDLVSGDPFANAFGEKIRTSLRVFRDVTAAHPELRDRLILQSDRALRHFSSEGNLKWVNLILWAGANPRSTGPDLDPRFQDDSECDTTALEEAAGRGHTEVLRRFKLTSDDPLSTLLRRAASFAHTDAVEYLLSLGANPNDKANGGSSAVDACLWHLEFEDRNRLFNRKAKVSRYAEYRTMATIKLLVAAGAIWRPDDFKQVQRTFLAAEPELVLDLLRIFKDGKACTPEELTKFLQRPKIREHVDAFQWHLKGLGVQKAADQTTISYYLLRRFDREKLYEQVWSMPVQKLSIEYGVSGGSAWKNVQETADSRSRSRLLGEVGGGTTCRQPSSAASITSTEELGLRPEGGQLSRRWPRFYVGHVRCRWPSSELTPRFTERE